MLKGKVTGMGKAFKTVLSSPDKDPTTWTTVHDASIAKRDRQGEIVRDPNGEPVRLYLTKDHLDRAGVLP